MDHAGVDMRVWAANPSTNVGYTTSRPEPTCPGYNDYGYRLDNRNTYMSGMAGPRSEEPWGWPRRG